MNIRIDQIPPSGRTYEVEIDQDRLERELGQQEDHGIHWTGTATGSITLEPVHGTLDIHGKIHARYKQDCARCLARVERDDDASFRLTKLLREGPTTHPALVELTAESIDEDYLTGDEIDLEEVLLEQIGLEISARVLCSENCRGLCPKCGVNWNEETCRCDNSAVDPRFAVLAQLSPASTKSKREDES